MILTDEMRVSCSFEAVLKSDTWLDYRFGKLNYVNRIRAYGFYCEALSFVIGMHPAGRFAHFEGIHWSATEATLLEYGSDEPATVCGPELFIAIFVATNMDGSGTPVFVSADRGDDLTDAWVAVDAPLNQN